MDRILIPPAPDRRVGAQDVGIAWNEGLLRAAVRPPKPARFVETPRMEEGDCDTLKMCYVTGKWTVTITQTLAMFSLQVAHAEWDDATRLSRAQVQEIAREFLAEADELELTEPAPGETIGRAVVPKGDGLARIPWVPWLKWMQGNGRAVVWFFKDDGHPKMSAAGPYMESNEYWFTRRPDRE